MICHKLSNVIFSFMLMMMRVILVSQHKDINEIEKQLNKDFESICDRFVDNKVSIHFGDDKTNSIFLRLNFPICNCGNAIESTKHYLLHCSNFKNERQSLLQNVRIFNPNLLSMNEDALTHLRRQYFNGQHKYFSFKLCY